MEVPGIFLVVGDERHLVLCEVGGRWVSGLRLYWGLCRCLLYLQSSRKFMVTAVGLKHAVLGEG